MVVAKPNSDIILQMLSTGVYCLFHCSADTAIYLQSHSIQEQAELGAGDCHNIHNHNVDKVERYLRIMSTKQH